jgi:hypothetical protein
MKVTGATFFGSGGDEGFVAASELHDGRIVAVGNAWGPKFPAKTKAVVLGKGRHTGGRGSVEQTYRKRKQTLTRTVINHAPPDQAGFVVWYDSALAVSGGLSVWTGALGGSAALRSRRTGNRYTFSAWLAQRSRCRSDNVPCQRGYRHKRKGRHRCTSDVNSRAAFADTPAAKDNTLFTCTVKIRFYHEYSSKKSDKIRSS